MRWVSVAAWVAAWLTPGPALAAGRDGAYGRLAGDLLLAGELGVVASGEGPELGARFTTSYVGMAGLYVEYDDGLGRKVSAVARRVAGGVDVRPLFLARFANDLETGPAALDLWVDSFGMSLGAYYAWRNPDACAPACSDRGLEFMWHMGLPLLLRANGPIIAVRAGWRWSLVELDGGGFADAQPVAMLSLGWQHLFATGMLDFGREAR